jgi:hypothetical protein
MTTGYEPLQTLKPVAPDIWLADGPVIRFYGLPFPTRMVVVRLADGGLFVPSPIAPGGALLDEVRALGPVRHLIAPNWIHYAWIADWQAAFPMARAWAAPGVVARAASRGVSLRFDHDLGPDAPPDWQGQIAQILVEGSPLHREVVFHHHASRTLIVTDLIENFEPAKVPLWFRPLIWLGGVADPDGKTPLDIRLSFRAGRAQARAAVHRMIALAPERVIMAHGRWYPQNGTAELRRAFRWLL